MKNIAICSLFLSIVILSGCEQASSNNADQVEYMEAFASVYGYVKYFHPSDEAQQIDWDQFAIYGAEQVLKCRNKAELVTTLKELFEPIAPTLQISSSAEDLEGIKRIAQPFDSSNLALAYWQHKGLGRGMNYQENIYHSVRVNRPNILELPPQSVTLNKSVEITQGSQVRFSGWIKLDPKYFSSVTPRISLQQTDGQITRKSGVTLRYPNAREWGKFEVSSELDGDLKEILVGFRLYSKGKVFIDDLTVEVFYNDQWNKVEQSTLDFENYDADKFLTSPFFLPENKKGYEFQVKSQEAHSGDFSGVLEYVGNIKQKNGESLFKSSPAKLEVFSRQILEDVFISMPLSLYVVNDHTYPAIEVAKLRSLKQRLVSIRFDERKLSSRLGNVVVLYNVLKHFYPYHSDFEVPWDDILSAAIVNSYDDQNMDQHVVTLREMMAKLKDGHATIYGGNFITYLPPILYEDINGEIIVTNVYDENLAVSKGTVIDSINGIPALDFYYAKLPIVPKTTESYINSFLVFSN